ncbi:calpain_III [Nesidiocoris tenuis]|uniref:Calpain_III n=1 Tax=Nesidiocoris tenuis TaxID=355587 RepID=A0ABN7A989_9HEMI|nr:calpain_III [Nesidiocoris tenuis]
MVRFGGQKTVRFKGQNYAEEKKTHLEQGTLFVDATFPAIDAIIGTSSIPTNITWKRPKDISESPRLFENVETPSAIHPGEISSGWVVSALSVLSGLNELRNKIVPDYWDQEWNDKNNGGIFHFRLWRFGNWVDVVVDDFLPTVDNVLLTTQSSSKNEFWVPLLEKAYAKLHGSYDALREGSLVDALVDFTGGVCETVDLTAGRYADIEDKRSQLFDLLRKENIDHSIVCFSVAVSGIMA